MVLYNIILELLIMEDEIRIYGGEKQVKKGKWWRPCCNFAGCTNRTNKELCCEHIEKEKKTPLTRIINKRADDWKQKLTDKSKEDKSIILKIIATEDEKEYDINELPCITRDDQCKYLCYCSKETIRNIRCILKHNMFCKIHSNEIKQQKRIQTTQGLHGEEITHPSQLIEYQEKCKKT